MSRFPQRWRTQRNAIRNANCKTSWIIKILNAHCAFGIFPVACLSECLWTPLSADYSIPMFIRSGSLIGSWIVALSASYTIGCCLRPSKSDLSSVVYAVSCLFGSSASTRESLVAARLFSKSFLPCSSRRSDKTSLTVTRLTPGRHHNDNDPHYFRISDQARGPAEFKHIIKRRKRN